ncbi:hypothetical protein, variant [Capsaspora owczarzaki ATCC 30864]|nr:hypothetical protein, variant [Capsaspora owczarzaki ATCC 30864]KJE89420.1 hypothetical protein, variant [Capsaspora owczarzaki ATCC 30864]|eukprot:XP_011269950.1 hypothetical protein, variant [Capsaspora owczarzaki ATCC 30864]
MPSSELDCEAAPVSSSFYSTQHPIPYDQPLHSRIVDYHDHVQPVPSNLTATAGVAPLSKRVVPPPNTHAEQPVPSDVHPTAASAGAALLSKRVVPPPKTRKRAVNTANSPQSSFPSHMRNVNHPEAFPPWSQFVYAQPDTLGSVLDPPPPAPSAKPLAKTTTKIGRPRKSTNSLPIELMETGNSASAAARSAPESPNNTSQQSFFADVPSLYGLIGSRIAFIPIKCHRKKQREWTYVDDIGTHRFSAMCSLMGTMFALGDEALYINHSRVWVPVCQIPQSTSPRWITSTNSALYLLTNARILKLNAASLRTIVSQHFRMELSTSSFVSPERHATRLQPFSAIEPFATVCCDAENITSFCVDTQDIIYALRSERICCRPCIMPTRESVLQPLDDMRWFDIGVASSSTCLSSVADRIYCLSRGKIWARTNLTLDKVLLAFERGASAASRAPALSVQWIEFSDAPSVTIISAYVPPAILPAIPRPAPQPVPFGGGGSGPAMVQSQTDYLSSPGMWPPRTTHDDTAFHHSHEQGMHSPQLPAYSPFASSSRASSPIHTVSSYSSSGSAVSVWTPAQFRAGAHGATTSSPDLGHRTQFPSLLRSLPALASSSRLPSSSGLQPFAETTSRLGSGEGAAESSRNSPDMLLWQHSRDAMSHAPLLPTEPSFSQTGDWSSVSLALSPRSLSTFDSASEMSLASLANLNPPQ